MSQDRPQGFGPVLANRSFRSLWMAQLLAQTSQNAIHFVQMVLIEQLTGSAAQIGLIILAFTLPGVIFSPIAGVVVDHLPKRTVLIISNLARVVLAAAYIPVLALLSGPWRLLAIYILTFLTATLAQFFSPAEASTIPMLVGERFLLTANSLFTLTMALSQVVGLLILGPLVVGLARVEGGFVIIALMYAGAALLVTGIPRDLPPPFPAGMARSTWRRSLAEITAGWKFVSGQARVRAAMAQLVTITTLVMIMAMLVPGYAVRVLGVAPQSAILVFAPAGLGMFLGTILIGRWGYRLRQIGFGSVALVITGLAFFAMGLVSQDYQRLLRPILHVYPHARLSLTSITMGLGLVLGLSMSSSNILSQTVVQQESPPALRGRVFATQFMLNNLVGIPPMLALGVLADALGIPRVMELIGVATVALAALGMWLGRDARRAA